MENITFDQWLTVVWVLYLAILKLLPAKYAKWINPVGKILTTLEKSPGGFKIK